MSRTTEGEGERVMGRGGVPNSDAHWDHEPGSAHPPSETPAATEPRFMEKRPGGPKDRKAMA